MDWDLLRESCDAICTARINHHLFRMLIGSIGGLLLWMVSGKADWQSIGTVVVVSAMVHFGTSSAGGYKFDLGDHIADASYAGIGATISTAVIKKWDLKKVGIGSVVVYLMVYPRSSP